MTAPAHPTPATPVPEHGAAACDGLWSALAGRLPEHRATPPRTTARTFSRSRHRMSRPGPLGLAPDTVAAAGASTPEPAAAEPAAIFGALGRAVDESLMRPRARRDVRVYHCAHDGEPPHVILKHPETHSLLRLTPEAYALWELCDGEHTARDLVLTHLDRTGAVAPELVLDFLRAAREKGFLIEATGPLFTTLGERLRGGFTTGMARVRRLFERKYSIPNFDAWMTRLSRGTWALFTRPMLVLAGPFVLFGCYQFFAYFRNPAYDLLKTADSFLLGLLVYVGIKVFLGVAHELAQAQYLKKLGHEVPEGGVLFSAGLPVLYTLSNDIWLESKRRRLLFSALGPLAELSIGAVAWVIVAAAPPGALAELCFKVGFLAYFGAFFKLNPLLELDGYFLLVDFVKLPMLKGRSVEFWQRRLVPKLMRREAFSREERVYTLFFGLVIGWSVLFFWLVAAIGGDRIAPLWHALTGQDIFALMIYVVLGLALLSPMLLAFLSWIALLWDEIVTEVVKFVRWRSQRLVTYVLFAGAASAPFLLELVPHLGTDDRWYPALCRSLCALGGVLAALVALRLARPLAVEQHVARPAALDGGASVPADSHAARRLKSRWIDRATHPLFVPLVIVGGGLALAQALALYDWAFYTPALGLLAGAVQAGALLALPPGVRRLAALLESYRWPPVVRVVLALRGLLAVFVGAALFFVFRRVADPTTVTTHALGLAALTWALVPLVLLTLTVRWSVTFLPTLGVTAALALIGVALAYDLVMAASEAPAFLVRQQATLTAAAGLTLAAALAILALASLRTYFRLPPPATRAPHDAPHDAPRDAPHQSTERAALTRVMDRLVGALVINARVVFGAERAERLRHLLGVAAGRHARVEPAGLVDPEHAGLDLLQLALRLRGQLSAIAAVFAQEFGTPLLTRGIVQLYDGLYWEERELARQYLLDPLVARYGVSFVARDATPRTFAETLALFSQLPLFADLTDDELAALVAKFRELRYPAGALVVSEGEPGDAFYVVLEGRVRVAHEPIDDTGTLEVLAELRRGDAFGEQALLSRAPRNATVRTLAPATLARLAKPEFLALAARFTHVPEKIEAAVAFLGLLNHMPIFRELSHQRVREIAAAMEPRHVAAGAIVVRAGGVGDAFFVVRRGSVRVLAPDSGAELARLSRGEYFGEIALLEDVPRTATVEAAEPTDLLVLTRARFERLLGKYVTLTSSLAATMSKRQTDLAAETPRAADPAPAPAGLAEHRSEPQP